MSSRSAQGKDTNRVLVHNDAISNAQSVIDPIDRRIHSGEFYTFSHVAVIAGLGTMTIRIVPSASNMHLRIRSAHGGLAETQIILRENAAFSATGALLDAVNHDRTTGGAPGAQFDPAATLTTGGILLNVIHPALDTFESEEWIMDPGVGTGEFVVTCGNFSASAITASVNIDFYEVVAGII